MKKIVFIIVLSCLTSMTDQSFADSSTSENPTHKLTLIEPARNFLSTTVSISEQFDSDDTLLEAEIDKIFLDNFHQVDFEGIFVDQRNGLSSAELELVLWQKAAGEATLLISNIKRRENPRSWIRISDNILDSVDKACEIDLFRKSVKEMGPDFKIDACVAELFSDYHMHVSGPLYKIMMPVLEAQNIKGKLNPRIWGKIIFYTYQLQSSVFRNSQEELINLCISETNKKKI